TQFDGILAASENDRDGCRGRLRRQCGRGAAGTNHRDLSAHELACERRQSIHLTFRPAVFDADIAVLDVTGLTQAKAERGNDRSECHTRSAAETPDYSKLRLLRARRERPCCRTAEEGDELAPNHSITSSASDRRLSEILIPSDFAVLRLITSSNLVGCQIGRSAGFAPFRIFAV